MSDFARPASERGASATQRSGARTCPGTPTAGDRRPVSASRLGAHAHGRSIGGDHAKDGREEHARPRGRVRAGDVRGLPPP